MKALGYIGAFLGGAIAGAAIGLLAAPEKGRDTRAKIAGTVEEFMKKHNIKLGHYLTPIVTAKQKKGKEHVVERQER